MKSPPETVLERLRQKLCPDRCTGMSGVMAGIVGCVLDQHWSEPRIAELCVTADGAFLARQAGDSGFNDFIGGAEDLAANLQNLWRAAELDPREIALFRARLMLVCQGWQHRVPRLRPAGGAEEEPVDND